MNIITGCARSGTTLTAGVLKACGANLGNVDTLNESQAVKNKVIKPFLRKNNADPLGIKPFLSPHANYDSNQLRTDTVREMRGADTLKEIKLLQFWWNWHEAFPDAKWVIVRRDIDSIADSCMRTHFMKGFGSHEGWKSWADHYLSKIEELKEHVDYVEVYPLYFLDGDPSDMKDAVEFCGLEWDEDKAYSVVKEGLFRR